MKVYHRITIKKTAELSAYRLAAIAGCHGLVTEDLTQEHRTVKGYMVYLDEPFQGEHTWFIPQNSVEHED